MAKNTQDFADKMTKNMMRCRQHDIKQVASMTGATESAAWDAIKQHGCKWLAIESLKAAA